MNVTNESVIRPRIHIIHDGKVRRAVRGHGAYCSDDECLSEVSHGFYCSEKIFGDEITKQAECRSFTAIINIQGSVEDFISGSFGGVYGLRRSEHGNGRDSNGAWDVAHDGCGGETTGRRCRR